MNTHNIAQQLNRAKIKFGVDSTDLIILGRLQNCWRFDAKGVKIMHIIRLCSDLGAPATLHSKIVKNFTELKLIKVVPSLEDNRVKYLLEGVRFKSLEKLLGEKA
jgi:hypothetical protein